MAKHLSRWTLAELKQYSREHGPLLIMRDRRTGRFNKRSYYDVVKRSITRNRPMQLRKLKLVQLVERIRRENICLPEDKSGKRGGLIKKNTWPPLKSFTSLKKSCFLTNRPSTVEGICGNGRWLYRSVTVNKNT